MTIRSGVLTRALVADLSHDLGRTLDVHFHARTLQALHNNAHPAEGRYELECPDNTQFQEMRVLSSILVSTRTS